MVKSTDGLDSRQNELVENVSIILYCWIALLYWLYYMHDKEVCDHVTLFTFILDVFREKVSWITYASSGNFCGCCSKKSS